NSPNSPLTLHNALPIYETPVLAQDADSAAREQVAALIAEVRKADRTLLTEAESKQLLALYGISTVRTLVASTADEAVRFAREIGDRKSTRLNYSQLVIS